MFCRAVIRTYSRAVLPTLLVTTPQKKAQGRLQGQEKVVSEKINLFG